MGKTWQTKKQIIQMLSAGQMTATDMAESLGVSQATVSQHIAELRRIGAIEEVDNEHIRKWKYYRVNPNFDADSFIKGENNMKNVGRIAIGVAVVVVIGLVALGLTYGHATQTKGNLVLSITDPPQVPAGTSALTIDYTSVQAHVVNSGSAGSNSVNTSSAGWVNATGSGTLDLMQLVNVTQVIGSASVPNGTSVNMLRFYVSSASITLNGTTYNVTLPSSEVTAKVSSTAINGTAQAIIDLTPTVIAIYGQNTTTFVMVPSVRAVVIPSKQHIKVSVGAQASLNQSTRTELEHVQPQLSIASTSLAVASNSTSFSVTLHNAANVPVTVDHVMLYGNMSVTVSPIAPFHGGEDANGSANASAHVNNQVPTAALGLLETSRGSVDVVLNGKSDGNVSLGGSLNGSVSLGSNTPNNGVVSVDTNSNGGDYGNVSPVYSTNGIASIGGNTGSQSGDNSGPEFNAEDAFKLGVNNHIGIDLNGTGLPNSGALLNASLNASTRSRFNSTFNSTLSDIVDVGVFARAGHVLNFEVAQNGSLVLPFNTKMFEGNGIGYTIAPNATVTLSFNGPVVLANGHLKIAPIAGDTYKVYAQGEEGARASANVTAS